jgi:hypothetical protein
MENDAFGEMYLWNRNADRLIRVLQRLRPAAICSERGLKAYEVRLEEIRAGLNADFAEAVAKRERSKEGRLRSQRTAWEAKTPAPGQHDSGLSDTSDTYHSFRNIVSVDFNVNHS